MTATALADAALLIALDWGTTSLRAYLLGAAGAVLDQKRLPWGIMHLPPAADSPGGGTAPGFELAFEAACNDWLQARPGLPVIACGMVGSAQGWREAAYLELPARLDRLAAQLTRVERAGSSPVHIVPGMIERGALPNVMRGEETQLAGVLATLPDALLTDGDVLVGLPGTHSKWVTVRAGEVQHFDTFMTGEVYAALCGHTILGRTMQAGAPADDAAFERGLRVAGSSAGRLGPLSTIFSSRTLRLTGELAAAAQADYLSGLLIGHEVAAVAGALASAGRQPHIVLCGEPGLCQRYAQALAHHPGGRPATAPQATERGLWQLALAAGLVPLRPGDSA